ncbi:SusC/RagA family TonB-linked outer membrane protein [Rhizosphaericola mali]|nr:SusC/RagA family TonB-linked outer membrane protein [Rhizosphaericola mali]
MSQEIKSEKDSIRSSKDSTRQLDEVVVTALGIKRSKRNLTFSTQEIKSDELLRAKDPSILNSMTGKIAGVQLTSSTGMPGSATRIVIRGATSLYGDNQALIILDGIPINNDETGNPTDGGGGSNRLNDLDPAIIDNVNILKGAAATALYGSAGARGVVLITTKKGTMSNTPKVSFSTSNIMDKAILPEHQMKYALGLDGQYYDGVNQQSSLSWGPSMDSLTAADPSVKFYNPLKEFYKTGFTTLDNVSVSGGNGKSDYVMSYSYVNQSGTEPTTNFIRHNFFSKYNVNILNDLTATFQLSYSSSVNNILPQSYASNPLFTLYNAPVSYNLNPYEDEDGNQRLYRTGRDNPYWLLHNTINKSNINRFIPVLTINWHPTNWLSIMERGGGDVYVDRYHSFVNQGSVTYTTGLITTNNTTFKQFNNDFIVTLNKDFGSKWRTNLILGNNIYSNYSENLYAYGSDLSIAGFSNMSNASNVKYTESSGLKRKVGFYSQAEIDYDKFLILSLTGRYDGSSVLSSDHRYYPYGSIATGFIFSEFLSENAKKIINFGKVRVSYASVGNDNVDAYANNTYYNQATVTGANGIPTNYPFGGLNGFLISDALGNGKLRNELQKEFETGLEMKFFDSRIGVEASYFHRNMSNGIVAGLALPYSTGYASTTINSSRMTTNGIELLINANPIRTKDFRWDLTINYTRIRTIVNEIAPGLDTASIGGTYAIAGQRYGMLMGTRYQRQDGKIVVDDNGLPVNNGIAEVVGNNTPNWLGGITNTFNYKNFMLSFFIDVKSGGAFINSQDSYGMYYGTAIQTLDRGTRVVNGVNATTQQANTVAVTGRDYWQSVSGVTESYVQNASYVKLRNVTFSYSLPKTVLGNSLIKATSITFTAKNIILNKSKGFTAGDPETINSGGASNGAMGVYLPSVPGSTSYGLSLNVNF